MFSSLDCSIIQLTFFLFSKEREKYEILIYSSYENSHFNSESQSTSRDNKVSTYKLLHQLYIRYHLSNLVIKNTDGISKPYKTFYN